MVLWGLLNGGFCPSQPTILHVAVRSGHVGVINRLIQARADLEARNCLGITPTKMIEESPVVGFRE